MGFQNFTLSFPSAALTSLIGWVQEVLRAAPYYFLGQNTAPVDVLQLSPQSVNVSINTAQGVFQSAGPSRNTALITLMVSSWTP